MKTTTPISEIKGGDVIIVTTDDRPSTIMRVTVAEVSYHLYSFQGWYEIIDTDGNHWQYNNSDVLEVEAPCQYCDATDSINFGQCISCNEQVEA